MPDMKNGRVRVGGPIRDLARTRERRTSWWGGQLSTRRPVASASPPRSDGTRPRLAAFDAGLARLEAIERHNDEVRAARRGIARATRRGRRLVPLVLLLAVAGIAAAAIIGAFITSNTQTVSSVVLAFAGQPATSARAGVAFLWNVTAIANPTTATFVSVYLKVQVLDGGGSGTPLTCAQVFGGAMITITEQPGTGGFSALSPFDANGSPCVASGGNSGSAAYFQNTLLTQAVNGVSVTYNFSGTWSSPPPSGSAAFRIYPAQ